MVALVLTLGAAGGWQYTQVDAAHTRALIDKENVRIQADADKQAADEADAAAAQAVLDEASAAAANVAKADSAAAAAGYSTTGKMVYYKSAHVSCGYENCAWITIMAVNPCPAGVYAAASLMSGGTSIGMTNGITAGLPAYGTALVQFEFASNPSSVTITDVHCMG